MEKNFELAADVVVVGFGAAGACVAIEAADADADVLVIDRFAGGGASTVSGGIVYAGGGTDQQKDAGVADSVDAMFDYLRAEAGDVVSEQTLRRFCAGSAEMVRWLESNGVPFEGTLCPEKTSYPNNKYYLYYSGSEGSTAFREVAKPAPRGHRARGRGTSGTVFYGRLAEAVRRRGVRIMPQTTADRLIVNEDGTVTGVEGVTLRRAPGWVRYAHRVLGKYSAKPGLYVPLLRKFLHRRAVALERRYAKRVSVTARRAVTLSTGGFIANSSLVREHAPAYRGGLPLGTSADDGTALRLGAQVDAATGELDRISAWRFITPPSAFLGGILVDEKGDRIIDESRYGAAVGEAMINNHGGKGWLLVDNAILKQALCTVRQQSQWFQLLQMVYLFGGGRISGDSIIDIARRSGIDRLGLTRTVDAYNVAAATGSPDETGKSAEYVRALSGPYSLIDVSIRPNLGYPCPMLTLGGLVVDEETGAVQANSGSPVAGLYAAGRAAVGICSRSYVSGLSLADCVFSGRRAGRSSVGITPQEYVSRRP